MKKLKVLVACEEARQCARRSGDSVTKRIRATSNHAVGVIPTSKDRAKLRSKTYQGVADAMADQFSRYLLSKISE